MSPNPPPGPLAPFEETLPRAPLPCPVRLGWSDPLALAGSDKGARLVPAPVTGWRNRLWYNAILRPNELWVGLEAVAMTLRDLLVTLPPDAMLPVGWLLKRLDGAEAGSSTSEAPEGTLIDLDCAEAGRLLGRTGTTIRGWCARGQLPGCYRLNGREWRIPRVALAALLQAQANGPGRRNAPADPRRTPPDLGRWRRTYAKGEKGT